MAIASVIEAIEKEAKHMTYAPTKMLQSLFSVSTVIWTLAILMFIRVLEEPLRYIQHCQFFLYIRLSPVSPDICFSGTAGTDCAAGTTCLSRSGAVCGRK